MNYDYIIVGGGVCGLTLATYLSKNNKKICLIEKESSLGGCNRVTRVNGLFSEHGPRVYSGAYVNFINILKELNLDFHDLFVPYNFNVMTSIKTEISNFKLSELFILFIYFLLLNKNYKQITMNEFMSKHNFSDKSKDNVDLMCRLVSGAGSDRTTLYKYFKLIDNNIFYKFYLPNKPMDVNLFNYWEEYLNIKKVDIIKGLYVNELINIPFTYSNNSNVLTDERNHNIIGVKLNNETIIKGNKIILAFPPFNISKLISNNKNTINAFGPFEKFNSWALDTNYMIHIPIVFHWDSKTYNSINNKKSNDWALNNKWGKVQGDWGIIYIVLSNYMDFNDDRSNLVISTVITKADYKSSFTNKTPHETNNINEIIDETFRQIKLIYPDLPKPTYAILNQNYYDNNLKLWIPKDTSFIETKSGIYDFKSVQFNNLFMCGTQNGSSNFNITTMETACTNALQLINILEPNINKPIINNSISLFNIIKLIYLLLLLLIIYRFFIIK